MLLPLGTDVGRGAVSFRGVKIVDPVLNRERRSSQGAGYTRTCCIERGRYAANHDMENEKLKTSPPPKKKVAIITKCGTDVIRLPACIQATTGQKNLEIFLKGTSYLSNPFQNHFPLCIDICWKHHLVKLGLLSQLLSWNMTAKPEVSLSWVHGFICLLRSRISAWKSHTSGAILLWPLHLAFSEVTQLIAAACPNFINFTWVDPPWLHGGSS